MRHWEDGRVALEALQESASLGTLRSYLWDVALGGANCTLPFCPWTEITTGFREHWWCMPSLNAGYAAWFLLYFGEKWF